MGEGYIGGEEYEESEYQAVRLAVLRITMILPPFARAKARADIIDLMEDEFRGSGVDVPPWMQRLREDVGW